MSKPRDVSGLIISTDDLGEFISVTIDVSVYDKAAVFKSAYWFTDTCYLFVKRDKSSQFFIIEFRVKDGAQANTLEGLVREFCNRLVDQQVRETVADETGEIRDALVKKAFFEGSKHLDPLVLRSNETNAPSSNQSYVDDPLDISQGS